MSLLTTLTGWIAKLEAANRQLEEQLTADVARAAAGAWLDAWGMGAGLPPAGDSLAPSEPPLTDPGDAWDSYNRSWHESSAAACDAAGEWSRQAVRGESEMVDHLGHQHTVDNGAEHFWIDNAGTIYGTDSWCPPDYANDYHELTPL